MSVACGRQCVEECASICHSLGYSVFVPERETLRPWDMHVNAMRVQVKARASATEQANRIRLKTYLGPGKVAYLATDFDALVVKWFLRWYVVPTCAIAEGGHFIKNGIYMPSVSQWVDRWDVLDGARVIYSQQKCFDF